jgi:hypothetical protein
LAKLSYCAVEVSQLPVGYSHARCVVLIGSNSFVGSAVQTFALHLLRLPRSLDVGDEVRNSIANLAGANNCDLWRLRGRGQTYSETLQAANLADAMVGKQQSRPKLRPAPCLR